MKRTLGLWLLGAASVWAAATAGDHAAPPLLLQRPTMNATHIVFSYAGDLWTVPRAGGDAQRLTAGTGVETDPMFSPDGKLLAFSGEYDGNVDVYVMNADGGVPRRLTYHPDTDEVAGWTPDGKNVLFRSTRSSATRAKKLFTVPVEGGPVNELPFPMAAAGSYSADGSKLAYMPLGYFRPPNAYDAWKRYRGGRTTAIWIADLKDSSVIKVPRDNSNDAEPMWIGNQVYFLSDRGGATSLYMYDCGTKAVTAAVPPGGFDLKAASAGPGGIVFEQFGAIKIYDLKSRQVKPVPITISADLPEVRPRYEKVATQIRSVGLSPKGLRAVFEARGEILTVPVEKGESRNITNSAGVMERDPAWSPDGRWIAYFSDESGEYALHLRDQTGRGEVKKIALGTPSFFYRPVWSPDSKKLCFEDKRLNLWWVSIDGGAPVKVDTDTYYDPQHTLDASWSPDSQWVVYTKQLKSHLRAVFAQKAVTGGQSIQLTDGMSDARYAAFDRDGKYLYFTASTDVGPTLGWIDMSSDPHKVTRSVYVIVLRKDLPSPLAPESDEEKVESATEKKPEAKTDAATLSNPASVTIDTDGISQRVLALPLPSRNYVSLQTGKAGVVYLGELDPVNPQQFTVQKFDLKTRKTDKVADGAQHFALSADGEKMLLQQGPRWFVAATATPIKPGEGTLKVDTMEVRVDPRAEWKQMYHEVWRIERDYFYDPQYHGLNIAAQEKKYEPYLDGIASRRDLNYLFQDMLGDITVGHLYVRGGEMPDVKKVPGGLLGADYRVENGRYRFNRVYNGENWTPNLRAPLTQPGVNVVAGEYLLSVNGVDVQPNKEVHAYLEDTADKPVVLRVGPDPNGTGARDVTVTPVANETGLRNLAWIEDNRRKVDQLSGGKLAYVYMPDTGGGGFASFNRYFFAQVGRQGVIIDERFNGGGQAADYVIDMLRRPLMNYWTTREGGDTTTPTMAIFGPKVMIVNEFAGSGGDAMPWYFRQQKIGTLVGKRTWGGLVGILSFPVLMDGGTVTAPNFAFWSPKGEWDVENHGVAPDVEVELDPAMVRSGHDPQLEKAVSVAMEQLKAHPLPEGKRPAFPVYNKQSGL